MTKIPTTGVSPIVKIFVIFLTVVTIVAFSVFFFKLVNKFSSSAKTSSTKTASSKKMALPIGGKSWTHELKTVGDKLIKAGLKKEAIEQYSKFLQLSSVDANARAEVSETVAKLYVDLGDCRQGLVWLYRAQVAAPHAENMPALEAKINACLNIVNTERP